MIVDGLGWCRFSCRTSMLMLCSSQPAIIFLIFCRIPFTDNFTGWVGQGPNVKCGDIESLADVWCSSAGDWIREMASDCSALTMLRHGDIALLHSVFKTFQFWSRYFHRSLFAMCWDTSPHAQWLANSC